MEILFSHNKVQISKTLRYQINSISYCLKKNKIKSPERGSKSVSVTLQK